jgi:hypothetical protein
MKKGKILIVGLIALLMAGGLVLAGCGPKCPDDKKCSWSRGSESSPSECSDKCVTKQGESYMQSHPDSEDGPPSLSCNCAN